VVKELSAASSRARSASKGIVSLCLRRLSSFAAALFSSSAISESFSTASFSFRLAAS
ncbi:uncharacterized protein METZ01_LOCUS446178, partial [marine metagenome]